MTFSWLKRYAPRSLYGRAALILLTPIISIQLVVSVVFVQRHYQDVTEQMSRNVALELRYIQEQIESDQSTGVPAGVIALADALRVDMSMPDPAPVVADRRRFYDLSGRIIIATLRQDLPGVTGIDLIRDKKQVHLTLNTAPGPLGLQFPRSRMSASNPHQLLVLMTGVGFLMSVIAFLFLRNQIRPIRRLAEAAQAFGRGHSVPYRPSGATEVRAAGSAFLGMRNRIERQIEQRTVMLSGVSHDLRTPLTRLKLGLSMLDDGPDTAELLGDVRDMEAMLDTFLDFARLDSLDDLEQVVPADLLEAAAEGAGRAGHRVCVIGPAVATPVMLRPMALRRALDNLVNNAVRHGTRIELSCQISERAVVFTVEDDGPGIVPEARERAMQPFTRLDDARSQNVGGSVGLGLSIALDIARQHGGTLRLDRSERLGGLRADLVLAR